MKLLAPNQYNLAAPLLEQITHHSVLKTILAGITPGHVYINDLKKPNIAFAQFKHRAFISGYPEQADGNYIHDFITKDVFENCRKSDSVMFRLTANDPLWINLLNTALKFHHPIVVGYQCYQISTNRVIMGAQCPEGFLIREVDEALLQEYFEGKDDLLEEMVSERESVEAFLENSFGICAFTVGELAGWCLSEYNYKNQCEVGIATMPCFQHKGLAKAMTRQFLILAHSQGMERVNWHCFKSNEASRRTALSVGFHLVEDEQVLMIYLDRALNLAAHGNICFEEKNLTEALSWYEKALNEENPQPWMAWYAACAAAQTGKVNQAFAYLEHAINLGFNDIGRLSSSEHLITLYDDVRWEKLITQLPQSPVS